MIEPGSDEVSLGGQRMAVLTWGPDDGRLVLAAHGYPDSAWTWRRVAPILADAGYRFVAPFSRGYAPSSLAADGCYGVGALVHDVVSLADRFGGGAPVCLVGHDWGAIAAYAAGSHRPELFSSLVTIAVPPMRGALRVLRQRRLTQALGIALEQARCSWYIGYQQLPLLPELTFDRVVDRLWADWSPGYDATEDLQHLRASLPIGPHRTAALAYYRALVQQRGCRRYRSEQRHYGGTPPRPLLYLHGDRDGCIVPSLAALAANDLPPGSRFEMVTGAGHFVHLEQPLRTAELMLAHIDRQEQQ